MMMSLNEIVTCQSPEDDCFGEKLIERIADYETYCGTLDVENSVSWVHNILRGNYVLYLASYVTFATCRSGLQCYSLKKSVRCQIAVNCLQIFTMSVI